MNLVNCEGEEEMVMLPPALVNLIALEIRLLKTCPIKSLSIYKKRFSRTFELIEISFWKAAPPNALIDLEIISEASLFPVQNVFFLFEALSNPVKN